MNLAHANVTLRPRSVLEILDLSCRFVVDLEPRLYLALSALLLGPALGACVAARWLFGWGWFSVWLLVIVLGALAQGAFTIAAGQVMFSERVPARQVLRSYGRRFLSYAAVLFLSRFLVVVAMPLAPFVWMRLYFVHEALLLEGASEIESLRRSSRFVSHHAKNAFELLLAVGVSLLVFVLVAELVGHGLVEYVLQSGQPFGTLSEGGSLYAMAGYLASTPFLATARFLAYIDARTRADGWDVQVRFMAIEAAETERLA
jgi:hypothetical protein